MGSTTTGTCTSSAVFNIIALGTGTGQTASSVTLATPLPSGCIAFADPGVTVNAGTTTQVVTVEVVFGGGGTATGTDINNAACIATITEAGLFNTGGATVTANNMFAVQSFTGVAIAANDKLTVTWAIDFT